MNKLFILLFFIYSSLFSNECNDEYSSKKFESAPDTFYDVIEVDFNRYFGKNIKLFQKQFHIKNIQGNNYFLKVNSYAQKKDYFFPKKTGVWKLHVDKDGIIDEVDFGKVLPYQNSIDDMANELNDELENPWLMWDGNLYESIMVPEYIKLHVDEHYITLNTFIFGSKDNALGLKNSVLNFHIINNTIEVNQYIKCMK